MSAKVLGALQGTLSKFVGKFLHMHVIVRFGFSLSNARMGTALQKPVVYNLKVAGEIAKQVYTKEGMSFPTGEQFNQAQQTVKNYLNVNAWKGLTVRDFAKGGVVFAEIYTFFLVGEIIGRRSLIGYNVKPAEEHTHH